jgi:hypothetical protein
MTESLSIAWMLKPRGGSMLCRNGRRTATSPGAVPRLNQTTHGHASLAGTSGRNPDQKSVEEIVAEMRQHYLPGVIEIPAAVGEIVRLQNKGYRLVVNH